MGCLRKGRSRCKLHINFGTKESIGSMQRNGYVRMLTLLLIMCRFIHKLCRHKPNTCTSSFSRKKKAWWEISRSLYWRSTVEKNILRRYVYFYWRLKDPCCGGYYHLSFFVLSVSLISGSCLAKRKHMWSIRVMGALLRCDLAAETRVLLLVVRLLNCIALCERSPANVWRGAVSYVFHDPCSPARY